jgi:hypothetical protein
MVKSTDTSAELNLKAIVKELNISVPIMATKMVGGKLMLYLYGGEVVEYQPVADSAGTLAKNTGTSGESQVQSQTPGQNKASAESVRKPAKRKAPQKK